MFRFSYCCCGDESFQNQRQRRVMAFPGVRFFVVGAMFFVSACSFTENTLWPSLTGESPTATKQPAAGQTPAKSAQMKQAPAGGSQPVPVIVAQRPPPLGSTNFQPASVTPGQATGTYVGKKVIDLRQELKRLQQSISNNNGLLQSLRGKIVANSQRYHGTIAAVNARLQVGTTPGNPILVQQFNSAQADLDRIAADITEMNALANRVSNNSTMSSFLSESARASFTVSGAVDEDHRQLAILEDEVNRTDVLISRLLKEVSSDVRRQTNYVATERANLNLVSAAIRSGEIFGGSLVNKALASATAGRSGNIAARPTSTGHLNCRFRLAALALRHATRGPTPVRKRRISAKGPVTTLKKCGPRVRRSPLKASEKTGSIVKPKITESSTMKTQLLRMKLDSRDTTDSRRLGLASSFRR